MGCSFLAVAFPWTEEPFSPQELIIAVPRVEKRRMLHEREMSHFPPVGPLRNHLHAAAAAPIWLLHARILLYEAALFTSQLESDILLALLALCGVNLLSPWPTSYDTYIQLICPRSLIGYLALLLLLSHFPIEMEPIRGWQQCLGSGTLLRSHSFS